MNKSNKKIAILLKSNLKYDGRVLAEIDTLSANYPTADFRLILLPNGPVDLPILNENIKVDVINIGLRKLPFKKVLIPLTTTLYTLMCFIRLLKYRPDILHVHDIFPVPSALLYNYFFKVNLIYDDHELFKVNTNIFQKLLYYMESKILTKAGTVLVANSHRARIVMFIYKLPGDKIKIVENYNHQRLTDANTELKEDFLNYINACRNRNEIVILHQGQVSEGRGLKYLIQVALTLPDKGSILFMGISEKRHEQIIEEYPILKKVSKCIGFVPYEHINNYWSRVDAALVFYDTKEINNKYCAPNRLYLALSNRVPLIVNSDNPVLSESVTRHNAGILINNGFVQNDFNNFLCDIKDGKFFKNLNLEFSFKNYSSPPLLDTYKRVY